MPLSMGFAWTMARIFGTTEWQLRAVNLVWGILAVLAFYFAGRRLQIAWLPLVLVIHPFFWYYMDEARPYAMQIACGAWLFLALLVFLQEQGRGSRWAAMLCLAGFTLCGSSLLGIIAFFVWLVVMAWYATTAKFKLNRGAVLWMAAGIILLLPLGLFYLWTLSRHAGGSRVWSVSWKNIAFSLYELGGFTGLGPGREMLRTTARVSNHDLLVALFPYVAASGLLALALCFIFYALWHARQDVTNKRLIGGSIVIVLATIILTAALAYVVKWPFWGRHLSAIVAVVAALIALAMKSALSRGTLGKIAVAIVAVLFLSSSLMVRFSSAHSKDDYRDAVRIVREEVAHGRRVWFAGDVSAATYYQAPMTDPNLVLIPNSNELAIDQQPMPDVVCISKPDIFDPHQKILNFLRENNFRVTRQLPAFQIFEPAAENPSP